MEGPDTWHRVATLSEIKDGEVVEARAGDAEIALCRIDGKIHAFDDICPHAYAQLSQGFVEGGEIECPLHGARFEMATGRCVSPPADEDIRTYPVRVEGDDVYVGLPANPAAPG
jgi:NAD(P)H-dependent nitrite reductase small subunit